jgi:sorbitol-specific phosphotransferase system component IIC
MDALIWIGAFVIAGVIVYFIPLTEWMHAIVTHIGQSRWEEFMWTSIKFELVIYGIITIWCANEAYIEFKKVGIV